MLSNLFYCCAQSRQIDKDHQPLPSSDEKVNMIQNIILSNNKAQGQGVHVTKMDGSNNSNNSNLSTNISSDNIKFNENDNFLHPQSLHLSHYQNLQNPLEVKNYKKGKQWLPHEDELLKSAVKKFGEKNWKEIAKLVPNRTPNQCQLRWRRIQPCKQRQTWTPQEDQQLLELVEKYGMNWSLIAQALGNRNGKQSRERYLNQLNPQINREKFTQEEDELLFLLFKQHGPKWRKISKQFNNRPENKIKNRFYSHIRKKYLITDELNSNPQLSIGDDDKHSDSTQNNSNSLRLNHQRSSLEQSLSDITSKSSFHQISTNSSLHQQNPLPVNQFSYNSPQQPLQQQQQIIQSQPLTQQNQHQQVPYQSQAPNGLQNGHVQQQQGHQFYQGQMQQQQQQQQQAQQEAQYQQQYKKEYNGEQAHQQQPQQQQQIQSHPTPQININDNYLFSGVETTISNYNINMNPESYYQDQGIQFNYNLVPPYSQPGFLQHKSLKTSAVLISKSNTFESEKNGAQQTFLFNRSQSNLIQNGPAQDLDQNKNNVTQFKTFDQLFNKYSKQNSLVSIKSNEYIQLELDFTNNLQLEQQNMQLYDAKQSVLNKQFFIKLQTQQFSLQSYTQQLIDQFEKMNLQNENFIVLNEDSKHEVSQILNEYQNVLYNMLNDTNSIINSIETQVTEGLDNSDMNNNNHIQNNQNMLQNDHAMQADGQTQNNHINHINNDSNNNPYIIEQNGYYNNNIILQEDFHHNNHHMNLQMNGVANY